MTHVPPAAERPLALAVRHINASLPEPIDEGSLLEALKASQVSPRQRPHLYAFFDEVEIETLSDLARSGAVTYETLAAGARRHLPPQHATRRWLDERA